MSSGDVESNIGGRQDGGICLWQEFGTSRIGECLSASRVTKHPLKGPTESYVTSFK